MILIKNAEVYAPEYLGKKEILICGNRIEKIADTIILETSAEVEIIDAKGKVVVPGFIDNHVHVLGGGGEGGFATRTPEIVLSQITKAGITTVIGLLGTDGMARSLGSLVAKINGLRAEGVSAYAMTGAYQVPSPSLTGSAKTDILYIDPMIGSGEIAMSDHRSSQPTYEEMMRIISETRVAGMLSGKAGVTIVHMGDGKRGLEYLFRMKDETELPLDCVLPTHICRSERLLEEGICYAKNGGYIDVTADLKEGSDPEDVCLPWNAIAKALAEGVDETHISMSSDGQGSLPIFDENKKLIGLGVGDVEALHTSFVHLVKRGIPLETALKVITSNPADLFKLKTKGRIAEGMDADITFLTENDLQVDTVLAMGRVMVENGKVIVKGTFE